VGFDRNWVEHDGAVGGPRGHDSCQWWDVGLGLWIGGVDKRDFRRWWKHRRRTQVVVETLGFRCERRGHGCVKPQEVNTV